MAAGSHCAFHTDLDEIFISETENVNSLHLQIATGAHHATEATLPSINEFNTLISDMNHDHLTHEIVAALGGIDKILNEYIRITREYENEEILSGPEMQKIADIISAETIFDKLYDRAHLMNNTFHFSSSDTAWHSILADRKIADRIVSTLFSKCTVTIISFAVIGWILCIISGLMWIDDLAIAVVAFLLQAILLFFFVSAILSCNIPSLLLILTTFDFWMKVGYSATLTIIIFLESEEWKIDDVWLATIKISAVGNVLLVMNLSLIEGHHGNWKVSFIFGLVVSLAYSWAAFIATFDKSTEIKYLELWFGFSIGLNGLQASCYRVLSLFLWKQTLMAAYTRGKCCICIYLSPYIKWIDR